MTRILVFALLLTACASRTLPPAPVETTPETTPALPPVQAVETPRAMLIAAAIDRYRNGAFAEAVDAFRLLGGFTKGEEHLRYYYAVALYETGSYADANKELACALPFIEVSDDVARYRARIEQMANLRVSR